MIQRDVTEREKEEENEMNKKKKTHRQAKKYQRLK